MAIYTASAGCSLPPSLRFPISMSHCLSRQLNATTAVRRNRQQMRQRCYNLTITVFLFSSLSLSFSFSSQHFLSVMSDWPWWHNTILNKRHQLVSYNQNKKKHGSSKHNGKRMWSWLSYGDKINSIYQHHQSGLRKKKIHWKRQLYKPIVNYFTLFQVKLLGCGSVKDSW